MLFRLIPWALATAAVHAAAIPATDYFPPPDIEGGWRVPASSEQLQSSTGVDIGQLDAVFEMIQGSTKNGGLLVVRNGWLVYERYFGLGHREASPNLGSCGKSFTSVAVGMLIGERPDLFPEGLEQKIFTPTYFPAEAFPLSDPRKGEIKVGQLLAFSAGIRGNNPAMIKGERTTIDPAGPDGWLSMVDAIALGKADGLGANRQRLSTATLWCEPGGGYSYASSSIHLASIMLRHVTGVELQDYLAQRFAPLGWGRWGFGYKQAKEVTHTPGAGGIALRGTDMLRFGYLLLREGRWKDRQIIPAEYVRLCGRASPYNPHSPYSLQFDVNTDEHLANVPRDAFWKSGSGGHVLYVVPSLDLVIWKLGGRDTQYGERDTGLPTHPAAAREARLRGEWRETVDADTAKRQTLQRIVAAVSPAKITAPEPTPRRAAPVEFWEHQGGIVAEVEDATLHAAEVLERSDASGGKVVGWRDETGRAEFALRVFTPGVWHVWIRTAAKDHVSNGLFLELNGVRQRAPAGHAWAGVESIYLRKHPTNFSWKPEWQGPGEGNHAGPIAITIPYAGLHRLAIVARKVERPTLDKLALTRDATPEFASNGAALGPLPTARTPPNPP